MICSICGAKAVVSESPLGNPDEPAHCEECVIEILENMLLVVLNLEEK